MQFYRRKFTLAIFQCPKFLCEIFPEYGRDIMCILSRYFVWFICAEVINILSYYFDSLSTEICAKLTGKKIVFHRDFMRSERINLL